MRSVEKNVVRVPVQEAGLVGTLFRPAGSGPYPAVFVLGGGEGGLIEGPAAALAAEGFVALALAYFGVRPLPRDLVEMPLEYFARGVGWLRGRPEANGERVAVLGSSRGGELALLLGATYPEDVGAVVGYVPSSVVYGGNSLDPWTWNTLYYRRRSSWTLGGRPLAFVDASPRPNDFVRLWSYPAPVWPFFGAWPAPRYRISLRRAYERPLDEDGASVRRAAIPVEKIRGPVLLVSGADDGLWPSSRLSGMAMRRLQFSKHPYPYEHLLYEKAGHMIPLKGLEGVRAPAWLEVGGTREADLQAGADAWPKVVALLGDHLR